MAQWVAMAAPMQATAAVAGAVECLEMAAAARLIVAVEAGAHAGMAVWEADVDQPVSQVAEAAAGAEQCLPEAMAEKVKLVSVEAPDIAAEEMVVMRVMTATSPLARVPVVQAAGASTSRNAVLVCVAEMVHKAVTAAVEVAAVTLAPMVDTADLAAAAARVRVFP